MSKTVLVLVLVGALLVGAFLFLKKRALPPKPPNPADPLNAACQAALGYASSGTSMMGGGGNAQSICALAAAAVIPAVKAIGKVGESIANSDLGKGAKDTIVTTYEHAAGLAEDIKPWEVVVLPVAATHVAYNGAKELYHDIANIF